MTAPEPSPSAWAELDELLRSGDPDRLEERLAGLDEPDLIHTLSHLRTERLGRLLTLVSEDTSRRIVDLLPDAQIADALEELPAPEAAEVVEGLRSDERVDVLGHVDDEGAEAILAEIEPEQQEITRALLEYPAESAGGLMRAEMMTIPSTASVGDALSMLRASAPAVADYAIQYLYVVDDLNRLKGVMPLRALLMAPDTLPVVLAMVRNPIAIGCDADLNTLNDLFHRHSFLGVPVVGEDHELLGIVERKAVDEAGKEHAEADQMKTLGIASGEELRSMPVFERSRRRLSWLLLNIGLNVVAASVIAAYQETLEAAIALAVFLPIISDMSGCSGNQAVAVSLRELALGVTRPSKIFRVLSKEAVVGLINGAVLGGSLAFLAWMWQGDPVLGGVVGIALAISTLFAVSVGGSVPLLIRRFGWDPALASGPILTTLTDVTGFFVTLQLATSLLIAAG